MSTKWKSVGRTEPILCEGDYDEYLKNQFKWGLKLSHMKPNKKKWKKSIKETAESGEENL